MPRLSAFGDDMTVISGGWGLWDIVTCQPAQKSSQLEQIFLDLLQLERVLRQLTKATNPHYKRIYRD